MNSHLKVLASAPGQATIVLVGNAQHYGEVLTIAFPQFSSISSQKVLEQSVDGDDLLLVIDADSLGDILEPDSPYQIKIPELEIMNTVIWPEIIGKRGASKGVINTAKSASANPRPVIEENTDTIHDIEEQTTSLPPSLTEEDQEEILEEVKEEEEAPLIAEQPKPRQSPMSLFLIAIVGIAIIAGGASIWYIKGQKHQPEPVKEQVAKKEEPKKEPAKAAETKPPAPPQPPKPEPSFAETLQKMSVPDVINKAPNTSMITQEGQRRLEAKQYDDGVLLLENAASKGDATAMLKLGMLYSPVDFKTGGAIPSPDMREAARYLQKADESGLKDAQAPRAALKDWLTKKADAGDDMARLTLKDFWK